MDSFYWQTFKGILKERNIYETFTHGNNRLYFRISEISVETMQTFTTN
jgi:hypothetical protein